MATKKTKQELKHAELFATCPYPISSDFELTNFENSSGAGYARHIIDIVNKIRKIESDLATETGDFEIKSLEAEYTTLVAYLDTQEPATLQEAVGNWQHTESEYWIEYLGKLSAVELLTFGKPTLETMTKMVKLPEDDYIKATQICVSLANAIQQATVAAEQSLGGTAVQQEPALATKKKLNLKKVK